jgi:apolipoprotein N-acyltransferase
MNSEGIVLAFIIGAIITSLLIVCIPILIIYGIRKKKRSFWITGTVIAAIWLFIYSFFYYSRYANGERIIQPVSQQLR